jgi:hypothetical protein
MLEKNRINRLRSLVLTSPYFLLVFLLVPVGTILCSEFHIPYPINLLLASNVCFLLTLFLRFLWCLTRMFGAPRYDGSQLPPAGALQVQADSAQLRGALEGSGYRFEPGGRYGEKRNLGYLGLMLLYGGLLTSLLLGTYDHLMQFTGAVRATTGVPQSLSDPEKYRNQVVGALASYKNMPHLLMKRQLPLSPQMPRGGAEIALYNEDGEELAGGTITAGTPLRYKGFEYDLTRFTYDAVLVILTTTNHLQYRNYVALTPVLTKSGLLYHGTLEKDIPPEFAGITGEAWYDPTTKLLKVSATRAGKPMLETELQVKGESRKVVGDYIASFEGMASWCEMRVFRTRHLLVIGITGAVALLGGLLRLVFWPQRVWLEESAGLSRVWAVGRETKKRVQG